MKQDVCGKEKKDIKIENGNKKNISAFLLICS